MFKWINECWFCKNQTNFPVKNEFHSKNSSLIGQKVDQAIQVVKTQQKCNWHVMNQIQKEYEKSRPRRKNIWEQIFRRKIYNTPCKLMLVFRRNSVMAFKCWIIKSSLILNKPDFFSWLRFKTKQFLFYSVLKLAKYTIFF